MNRPLPIIALATLLLGGGVAPVPGLAQTSADTSNDADCAATPYEIMGQAWRVDFSTGGLIPDSRNLPIGTVYPPTIQQVFGLTRSPKAEQDNVNVTVIVVDRFTTMPISSKANAPKETGGLLTLNVRHGALVAQHLQAMLLKDGFTRTSVRQDRMTFTRGKEGKKRTVTVVPLDFSGNPQVTGLAKQFTNTVNDINDPMIIVNMSFVLIRCDVLNAIKAKHDEAKGVRYTLDSYLEDNDVNMTPAGRQPIFQTSPLNPLLKAIIAAQSTLSQKGQKLITVAASGNFDGDVEKLWPGAAESVISVSATGWPGKPLGLPSLKLTSPNEKPWSSPGDTRAVGEWYELNAGQLSDQCTSQAMDRWCVAARQQLNLWPHFAYRGTSFSAPSLTALLASRLPASAPGSCLPDAKSLADVQVSINCF